MRKIGVIFLIFLGVCGGVYPFWIWSPKTGKWKNPSYSPYSSPGAQLQSGLKLFLDKKYKRALKEFKKVIAYYPDAKEAAEAQYYKGRCLEELGHLYEAFLAYQKLITTYPNSKRIQEAVEREYRIGEYFMNRKVKHFMGVPLTLAAEDTAIDIFQKIVDTSPSSPYAPRALYSIGVRLNKLGRYGEAQEIFKKLIEDYPDSELVEEAKYQMAIASSKVSMGPDYDQTSVQQARRQLEEFIQRHPDVNPPEDITSKIKKLKEDEAKKVYDTALFYEKQGKTKSALIYYRSVVDEYSDTSWAQVAKEKIKVLSGEVK